MEEKHINIERTLDRLGLRVKKTNNGAFRMPEWAVYNVGGLWAAVKTEQTFKTEQAADLFVAEQHKKAKRAAESGYYFDDSE